MILNPLLFWITMPFVVVLAVLVGFLMLIHDIKNKDGKLKQADIMLTGLALLGFVFVMVGVCLGVMLPVGDWTWLHAVALGALLLAWSYATVYFIVEAAKVWRELKAPQRSA